MWNYNNMMEERENGKVMVYIDNSNIFISTQKYSAIKKKIRNGMWDNNCRIDVGKLVHEGKRGRDIIHGKLYGSEPPVLDTVWRAIREKKIQVHLMEKSKHSNREKRVDTSLSVAATEDLIEYKHQAGASKAIIFFTGDVDMLPVVQSALKHGWRVEIWSYEAGLHNDYRREQKLRGDLMSIYFIDTIFDKITFQKYDWTFHLQDAPRERSIVCRFKKTRDFTNPMKLKKKLKEVVCMAVQKFHLPFQGKFIELVEEPGTIDLLLVPSCGEKNKEGQCNYDFNKHIWKKHGEFEEAIKCKMITFVDYKNELISKEYDFLEFSDDESENNNNIDTLLADPELQNENEDVDDFKLVIPKRSKKHQLYSRLCDYRFCCHHGLKCNYAHTDVEKEYFREHPNVKHRALYKSKPCKHGESCKYKLAGREKMCPFVHDPVEIRCLSCKRVGLHWTDECPIPRQ